MKVLQNIITAMGERAELVAVSKFQPIENIQSMYELGVTDFGENRVQELVAKAEQLPHLTWHFIGRLQTNKAAQVVQYAALIHSLDRPKLAVSLQQEAMIQQKTVRVLIQVNLAEESSKAGFLKEEVIPFLHTIEQYPNLMVEGIMCMGPHVEDHQHIRHVFREARHLFETIHVDIVSPQVQMKILSMGMSQDYEIALEEGSTMLRIGSLLFNDFKREIK